MDFFPKELNAYIEAHTSPETETMKRLNRETHAKIMLPQMLSGHLQGQVLKMISHMLRPKTILEIGTYTGYSAICLADGLAEGGKLISIDVNEELKDMIRHYWKEAGIDGKSELIIGNAMEIIPGLDIEPDLVFIDADKQNYSNYYDLVLPKLRKGGIILADNVLWSGKVIQDKADKDTTALKEFNDKIHNDNRVENVLLPLRDGIMMVRKL